MEMYTVFRLGTDHYFSGGGGGGGGMKNIEKNSLHRSQRNFFLIF